MSGYLASFAVVRETGSIATEHPALWREIRRFNLPVKLALAAAQRVIGGLPDPAAARLLGLAPCRPGSPELRKISRELDAGFERGSCASLRVNPIYTLHAIDNLALSALAIRIENRAPCVCFGGAAGQAFAALERALDETDEGATALVFGGDQSDASWVGGGEDDAAGVAVVVSAQRQRVRIVEISRADGGGPARPHATAGLARFLEVVRTAAPGRFTYAVPDADGDGIDRIAIVVEVAA
jgi:hypothetical protein